MTWVEHPSRNPKGFTMLEVVVVMVLIGIVGAVLVTRSNPNPEAILASESEALRIHLQYAQMRAFNTSCSYKWEMRISSSPAEWQLQTDAPGLTPALPGTPTTDPSRAVHRAREGIRIVSAPTSIFFNCWGEPVTSSGNAVTTNQDIVLGAVDSSRQVRIRVLARTGKVIMP